MGRVSRYKKQKRVFDVEQLFRGDGEHDDAPSARILAQDAESRTRKRALIVKYDAEGNAIQGPGAKRQRSEKPKKPEPRKREAAATLEKRQAGESMRDFNVRVARETQERLRALRKKQSNTGQRRKQRMTERKEKLKERKRAKAQAKQGEELTDKERRVYAKTAPRSLHDVASAPPEFGKAHMIKKSDTDPTDRSRFAKLSFTSSAAGGSLSGAAGKAPASGKQRTEYEKLQMEAMRLRVLSRYDELRKERRAAAAAAARP